MNLEPTMLQKVVSCRMMEVRLDGIAAVLALKAKAGGLHSNDSACGHHHHTPSLIYIKQAPYK